MALINWFKLHPFEKLITIVLSIFTAWAATMFVPYQLGNFYGPVAIWVLGSRFWLKSIHFTKFESGAVIAIAVLDIIIHLI